MYCDNVTHEGDVLKMIGDETPPHKCPKCGNREPSYVETVDLEREFVSFSGDGLEFSRDPEWHRGAGHARLCCPDCQTEWSLQKGIAIKF